MLIKKIEAMENFSLVVSFMPLNNEDLETVIWSCCGYYNTCLHTHLLYEKVL